MDDKSTQLRNISALLDYGVDPRTFSPWLSFACLTDLLTIHVKGLVYMGFSRDWPVRFCSDSGVIEVRCEYRHLSEEELVRYGRWRVNSPTDLPKLTVVIVEGPLYVEIVCESYDIALEPLSRKYPDMV
jgi:hypothetical protein